MITVQVQEGSLILSPLESRTTCEIMYSTWIKNTFNNSEYLVGVLTNELDLFAKNYKYNLEAKIMTYRQKISKDQLQEFDEHFSIETKRFGEIIKKQFTDI